MSIYIDLPGLDLVGLAVNFSMINRVRGLHFVPKGWWKLRFPPRWLGGGQGGEGDLFLEVLLQVHARLKGTDDLSPCTCSSGTSDRHSWGHSRFPSPGWRTP